MRQPTQLSDRYLDLVRVAAQMVCCPVCGRGERTRCMAWPNLRRGTSNPHLERLLAARQQATTSFKLDVACPACMCPAWHHGPGGCQNPKCTCELSPALAARLSHIESSWQQAPHSPVT